MQPWREKLAGYWDRAGQGPLRPTVAQALAAFVLEGRAAPLRVVDLGCGAGRDTLPLLAKGHTVHAIDREQAAIDRLCAACPPGDLSRLTTTAARFEDADWAEIDLAVSSFALPFCPPGYFAGLFARIHGRLAKGGRLACQLLGPRDDFAGQPGVTIHTSDEVAALLAPFIVERLDEEEVDTVTPRGRQKHWHLFHVVARKP
jgi:tellurite methyltransferase